MGNCLAATIDQHPLSKQRASKTMKSKTNCLKAEDN